MGDVREIAAAEIGYVGSGSNDNPATKYGAWYGIDGSLGDSNAQWCNMFVDWVFDQAGATNHPGVNGSATVCLRPPPNTYSL